MTGARRSPSGNIAEFDALIACYRSGQISERQWQDHRSDAAFAAYADEMSRPREPVPAVAAKPVIVRTGQADIYFGLLKQRHGKEVELEASRRIWHANGASTLAAMATAGMAGMKIRIGAPVSVILTDVVEIIVCTAEAARSISAQPDHHE